MSGNNAIGYLLELLKFKFLAVFLAIGYFLDVNDIITIVTCWMMSVDNLTSRCLIVEATKLIALVAVL